MASELGVKQWRRKAIDGLQQCSHGGGGEEKPISKYQLAAKLGVISAAPGANEENENGFSLSAWRKKAEGKSL